MTDRIKKIYDRLLKRDYRALRTGKTPNCAEEFAREQLSLPRRAGKRLLKLAEAETAVVFEGDRIGFLRTVREIPSILTAAEENALKKSRYIFDNGGVGNISSDYGQTLSTGLEKKKEEISEALKRYEFGSEEREELTAMLDSIDAAYLLAEKYRTAARERGCPELAAALSSVPASGAKSYYEALVFLRFLNFMLWLNGNKHNTLGRFDVYMYPFYKKDIENGTLTREEALELTEEFFISLNADADLYPGIQQGDNGQSLMLGGVDKDGKEVFNDLSRLCLEASLELRLIDPKINLRVDSRTKDEIFCLGTRLTKQGLGFPQYSNDDVVIPALVEMGYDLEDARDYTVAACWEFIVPGKGMDIPNIDALNFPLLVNRALETADETAADFDSFWESVKGNIFSETERIAQSVKNIFILPSPFQSLLMDGCIESARDISEGGKYNNYGIHGAGLSNAADALAAIKKNVFDEKTISLADLRKALKANFIGYEAERNLLLAAPKAGNNDDFADNFVVGLLDSFSKAFAEQKNERGGTFRAGTGTAMYYVWCSQSLGATADGRKSGEPFSANYSPSLGVATKGVLSVIQSFTKADLKKTCNGGPLTLEFHDTVFRNDEGLHKVAALVKTFILKKGHQLQLNSVNRDILLDAKIHPDAHKNLIVRVWGWSGYFNELDPEYQEHVIRRLEYLQ